MSLPWQISLLTRWEEIESPDFVDLWQRIMDSSDNAHVFFHPVLVRVWLDTYRPLRALQPLFVLARRGEQQVVFPLVLWRRNAKNAFLRTIVPAGHSDFDYHDPVFLLPPDEEQVQSFYAALKAELDKTVKYDRIMLDGMHKEFVPEFCKVVHQEVCLSANLDESPKKNGFVVPVSKNQTKSNFRRLRRLEEVGKVDFSCVDNIENIFSDGSFEKMMTVHARRWPNAYKAPGFHKRLVQEGHLHGLIDVAQLQVDHTAVAWQISFTYKQRYSLYMPSVDDEFYQYSSGFLVMGYALHEAERNGYLVVDHLRGAEEYKSTWGGAETLIYDAAFESATLSSRLRLALFNLVQYVKVKHGKKKV